MAAEIRSFRGLPLHLGVDIRRSAEPRLSGGFIGDVGSLLAQGLEVLLDDREASAGVRFGDADWSGFPIRITAGRRSAEQGGFELVIPGGPVRTLAAAEVVEAATEVLHLNRPGELM